MGAIRSHCCLGGRRGKHPALGFISPEASGNRWEIQCVFADSIPGHYSRNYVLFWLQRETCVVIWPVGSCLAPLLPTWHCNGWVWGGAKRRPTTQYSLSSSYIPLIVLYREGKWQAWSWTWVQVFLECLRNQVPKDLGKPAYSLFWLSLPLSMKTEPANTFFWNANILLFYFQPLFCSFVPFLLKIELIYYF